MTSRVGTVSLTLLLSLVSVAFADDQVKSSTAPGFRLERWVDVQAASLSSMYRFIENSDGKTTLNYLAAKETLKASLKLDGAGRYSVHAGVFTGGSFAGSWNATGVGTGDSTYRLYLKQLFASARPVKGLELQAGSMYFLRGESTEITTFDMDGYVTGSRVRLTRRELTGLDELSVTSGYVGDRSEPSFLRRTDRMADWNYLQVLGGRALHPRVRVSMEVTVTRGAEVLRQGVALRVPEFGAIDSIRAEAYQRLEQGPSAGFAMTAGKTLGRVQLQGGYATLDFRYGGLNADRFPSGRRVFGGLNTSLPRLPELSFAAYVGRAVGNDRPMPNRTRVDLSATYDVLAAIQRARR